MTLTPKLVLDHTHAGVCKLLDRMVKEVREDRRMCSEGKASKSLALSSMVNFSVFLNLSSALRYYTVANQIWA